MKRRRFLCLTAGAGLAIGSDPGPLCLDLEAFASQPNLSRVEARYYQKLEDREIECRLCPRFCRLGDLERGYCGVRENQGGTYYTLVYGKACTANVDPIEKKPFFHFLPTSRSLSIATAGCNVNCRFCQNWEISQVRPEQIRHFDLPPQAVVDAALRNSCPVIAYTYSEPLVFFEYMVDTSVAARDRGIKNVVVTGGHTNPEPFQELLQVVDAVKIDLKSFRQDFYTKYVRGELQPVLDAIKAVSRSSAWLEIVYLVIPSLNDAPHDLRDMSRWVLQEVGQDVPVHFSRFHPYYLMKNLPPTPVSTLERARDIALEEGLSYVYIGNVPGHEAENTYCPECRTIVVRRRGYEIRSINLTDGRCSSCSHPIPGVWRS